MNQSKINKICILSLFIAVSLIFSYVEMLIPLSLPVPGAKLGLANIMTLSVLYLYDQKSAFIVLILRIFLGSLLFTNFSMMLYSLSGGILSLIIMCFLKKTALFKMYTVSVMGGIFHNIGQLIMALFIFNSISVLAYLPYLMVIGCLSGCIIGVLSNIIYSRIRLYVKI